jgi:hypothetical protein
MVPEKLTKINLSLGKVLIIIPQITLPIRTVIKTDKIFKDLIISKYVFRIKGVVLLHFQ